MSHFVVKWSNCPRASHTKVIKTQKNSVSEKGWDNSRVGEMETDLISDELKQLKKDQIEHEKLSKSLRVHLSHSFLFLLNSSKLCKRVHVLHQIGRSRNQKKSKLDGLLKWKWMKVDVNFSSFGPSAFTKNYPLRFNWSSTLARLRPIFIKSFWSLWNPKFWPSTFTPFTLTHFDPVHSKPFNLDLVIFCEWRTLNFNKLSNWSVRWILNSIEPIQKYSSFGWCRNIDGCWNSRYEQKEIKPRMLNSYIFIISFHFSIE